ncbi:MAG: magnesium/cobalt transporter CorA [Promethearchaeota archaeon]
MSERKGVTSDQQSTEAVDKDIEKSTKVLMIDFNQTELISQENILIKACAKPSDSSSTRWVHVNGETDTESISQIGKQFDIHSLIMEDILNTKHRPKLDMEPDQFCLILRDMRLDEHQQLESEQISIVIGPGFVLSFQESDVPLFTQIKNRISNPKSRIRKSKSDFLGYSLIDIIVDRYIASIDTLADQVEELEDTIPLLDKNTPSSIYRLRHMIGIFQRNVRPLREAVFRLLRNESGIIETSTMPYLRDLYDHLLYIGEMADTYKETLSNMLEIYLLGLDRKTNEIVKILVVVSTILLPLTFIASFFGMNFRNMPFDWEYGYPFVIIAIVLIGAILTFYFRSRKWI